MNRDSRLDEIRDLLDERTPYGTRPIAPTAPIAPFSQAAMDAADNLLIKAVNRIRRDEHAAADRLIDRAADLSFDDHEQMWPGINMAAVRIYSVLADQSELIDDVESAPGGEDAQLVDISHAIRTVSGSLAPDEGEALRYAVKEILTSADYHGIDRNHQERMREAIDLLPRGEHDRDLSADAPKPQRVAAIAAACRVSALLLDAFDGDC